MARPTNYSQELAEEIAYRIAKGGTLQSVSKMKGMPSLRTLLRWSAQHVDFLSMLDRAREDKATAMLEGAVAISDEPVQTLADAARNRVRVQTRLHVAEKLFPRRYGARVGVHGVAGEPPVGVTDLSDYDKARRLIFAFRQAVEVVSASSVAQPLSLTYDPEQGGIAAPEEPEEPERAA